MQTKMVFNGDIVDNGTLKAFSSKEDAEAAFDSFVNLQETLDKANHWEVNIERDEQLYYNSYKNADKYEENQIEVLVTKLPVKEESNGIVYV